MIVIKRDGRHEEFDKNKIATAIKKAMTFSNSHSYKVAENIADEIEKEVTDKISVPEIESMVFNKLIAHKQKLTAKLYEGYRAVREFQRKTNTIDNELKELLSDKSEYWNEENSNKNALLVNTKRDYIAGVISKDLAARYIYPADVIQADEEGIIHIHDRDYSLQKLNNCFKGDTKFVTNFGVRKFNDFYDGQEIEVQDKDGVWRRATVRCYGKQNLQTITFRSCRTIKEVVCTQNHRWILSDGSISTNIKIGDTLCNLSTIGSKFEYAKSLSNRTLREIQMFNFGFFIGDGCNTDDRFGRIRLCGNKIKYIDSFINHGYKVSGSKFDNDDILMNTKGEFSKSKFLSSYGWRYLSKDDCIALFFGLMCADGAGDNSITTANVYVKAMIEEISAMCGYYISATRTDVGSTNYKDDRTLYYFSFRRNTNYRGKNWKVIDIKPYRPDTLYNVWCVEEPVTHTFRLADGIVTGNCELINLEDMLQNGTVINGVQIDKPHRLLTAMTIATQVILSVTSMSYGGTSINLGHLAPFVRDSYKLNLKKYKDAGLEEEICKKLADIDIKKEISDAVQTFNYQLNSMTNTNG